MRNKVQFALLALGVALVGCGKDADVPAPKPAPPAAPDPNASVNVNASVPVTTPPPAVAPPSGGLVPAAPAAPAATSDSDLLGGNGRPLTEEEKMLLNYGIEMFRSEKGRYPKDLAEAVASRHIARMPKMPAGEELKYDSASGKVTVVKK